MLPLKTRWNNFSFFYEWYDSTLQTLFQQASVQPFVSSLQPVWIMSNMKNRHIYWIVTTLFVKRKEEFPFTCFLNFKFDFTANFFTVADNYELQKITFKLFRAGSRLAILRLFSVEKKWKFVKTHWYWYSFQRAFFHWKTSVQRKNRWNNENTIPNIFSSQRWCFYKQRYSAHLCGFISVQITVAWNMMKQDWSQSMINVRSRKQRLAFFLTCNANDVFSNTYYVFGKDETPTAILGSLH